MEKKPIIAVIILNFNNRNNIEKCINSVLEQKTVYPYEIRVYDDCSTDGAQEIITRYSEKYPDRVKAILQTENTFCKNYDETQGYEAVQEIDTEYFCIMEGDDYWCDENKLQIGLDFLEKNPDYVGWAHDTMHNYENTGLVGSWVHDLAKFNVKDRVDIDSDITFFFTSSRIFRNCGFKDKKVWSVDYLIYFYHLTKGPIYYYDKIMSVYNYGCGVWSSFEGGKNESMIAYKVAKLLDFEFDNLSTRLQQWYDKMMGVSPKRLKFLILLKKLFGIKLGWNIWFFLTFVPKYGLASMNVNYVFPRKKVKGVSEKRGLIKKNKNNISDELLKNIDDAYKTYILDKTSVDNKIKLFALLNQLIKSRDWSNNCNDLKNLLSPYVDSFVLDLFGIFNSDIIYLKNKIKQKKRFYKKRIFILWILLLLLVGINVFFINLHYKII